MFLSCSTQSNILPSPITANQMNINEGHQLKILSWNIKMLPTPYGWLLQRQERADNIIQFIKELDLYDIIFFQEAFSGSIRRKIYSELESIYPYAIEPDDQTAFYKSNSRALGNKPPSYYSEEAYIIYQTYGMG